MLIPIHVLSAVETAENLATTSDIPDGVSAIAAVVAVVVSAFALARSYKASQRSAYLETITASRERWQISLRECSAQYFSQLMRVCNPHEQHYYEAFTHFSRYHHEIRLHLFKCDHAVVSLLDDIMNYASEIVQIRVKLEDLEKLPASSPLKADIAVLQRQLDYKGNCILTCKKPQLVVQIAELIEIEWRKQHAESTVFWGKGISKKIIRIRNDVYNKCRQDFK